MFTKKYDNLCNFAQSFISNSDFSNTSSYTINVGIFGGSVTVGRETEGCQRFSESSTDSCTWVSYFSRWLQSIVPPQRKLNIMNFAMAGTDSCHGRDVLVEDLIASKKFPFQSTDLVLLDYSINDAQKILLHDKGTAYNQQVCVEGLIRKLLTSGNSDSNGNRHHRHLTSNHRNGPTIVLLEFAPFESAEHIQFTDLRSTMQQQQQQQQQQGDGRVGTITAIPGYSHIYRRLADHYGVPIWSYYRAVTHSKDPGKSSYLPTLQFRDILQACASIHPAWFVHLFTADLYASVLARAIGACSSSSTRKAAVHHHHTPDNNKELPPVLTAENTSTMQCNHSFPLLLHVSARTAATTTTTNATAAAAAGSLKSNQQQKQPMDESIYNTTTFRLVEERSGKFGWIDEFPTGFNASYGPRKLLFHLRNNSGLLSYSSHDAPLLVRVEFLRTYYNAGRFVATFCGHWIGNDVDTLWNTKISTSEVFFYVRRVDLQYVCSEHARRDNDLRQSTLPSLEIVHVFQGGQSTTRTAQEKVKILSIKVCIAKTATD